MIILVVAMYPIKIWQFVGLWRSATNHIKIHHRRFWAGVSKIFVLLSFLGLISQALCASSNMVYLTKIAFGLMPFDEYRVTLDDGGRTLVISGGIGHGLVDEVESILAGNSAVRVVQLNSFGGRLTEGHRLNKLITRYGLTTYSEGQCDSACAIAFMGGLERVLHENGQLGFHRPSAGSQDNHCLSMETDPSDEGMRRMVREETRKLIEMGVDPGFAKKAMSIPSGEIWRPTHDQLIRAGVISRTADEA
jgi:hypothetical protein